MDEELRAQIRILAEENGLDPEVLEVALDGGGMPPELMEAMTAVLGDVGFVAEALGKKKP